MIRPSDMAAGAIMAQRASLLLPWRAVIAGWTIERRQRWGWRTAELEDLGMHWRDAEREAFNECLNGPLAEDRPIVYSVETKVATKVEDTRPRWERQSLSFME